jgi:surface protein
VTESRCGNRSGHETRGNGGATNERGNVNDWDVSQVTNMASLFGIKATFNDRIDRWDVRNVTSMAGMFLGATAFNQPLDTWDVRQVTAMHNLLCGASSLNQS